MLKDLGLNPSLSLEKRTFKVQLAQPNQVITQNINNINVPELSDVGLNKLPHFEFEIPYFVRVKTVDNADGTYIKNPDLISIKEEKLIKLTFYNDLVLWFRINKITKTESGAEKTIKISCDGLESELRKTKISLTGTGIDVQEYFEQALEQTGWKLGTISDGLKETYRTFDDENNKTKYEAIQNGIETFGAIADFDGSTRTLNLFSIGDLRVNRGVVLKRETQASSIEIDSDSEEIVTRLYVTGNENLTIENSNPTGMRYIEDFSYFLAPFERDENKNVIKHSNYMSDELAHALLDLKALKEEYLPEITKDRNLLDTAYADLSSATLTKVDLDNQLITAQSLLDTAKATNDLPLVAQRELELEVKEEEIATAQELIDNIQLTIDTLEKRLSDIQNLISISSFDKKTYDELMLFVYEKDFTDDRYIDAKSLYEAGLEEFEKYQKPTHAFTVEMESFLNAINGEQYKGRLQLGEEVRVKSTDFEEEYTSIIVSFSGELDTGNYKVEISDSMDDINSMDKLVTLLYQSESSASTLSNNKYKWDNITSVKDEVTQWRDKEITAVNNRIIAGANESISIDNRGMIVKNPDFPDEMIIIQSGVVALSKDGGKTWSTSITPDGVIAERLVGKIIAGNNLIITNDAGTFSIDNSGLTIDMDSIQIMSGDSGNPENVIDSWNQLLLTYSEISNDNLVNKYEKNQLKKQWTTIVDINSSMINAFNKGWGDSTEAKPKEYNDYLTAYEALNSYLNKEKQSDGFTLLDESNINNTSEIVSEDFQKVFRDYEVTKQSLESIISLEFTKSQILVLEDGIKLQYVKNDNIVTQLNLSEEGIKIDGKLLEINSRTEFNADLVMNAGVIQDKDGDIKIDLNKGEIILNKPITIGSESNLATKDDIENIAEQYVATLTNETATIPTDMNGSQGDYSNAVTSMNIYKGGVLDNDNWTFSYTTGSDFVATMTGNQLTVTSLRNNTAKVTIKAVKDKFSITKVFSLSKVKSGESVTRYWIMSQDVIHKNSSGVYVPATITVLGYKQLGQGTATEYAGRFLISETTDGTTYSTKYTSSKDESSVTYTPSANIVAVKVRFYLAGGTITMLDEQTMPVVKDGDGAYAHIAYAYSSDGSDRFVKTYPNANLIAGTKLDTDILPPNITEGGGGTSVKVSIGDLTNTKYGRAFTPNTTGNQVGLRMSANISDFEVGDAITLGWWIKNTSSVPISMTKQIGFRYGLDSEEEYSSTGWYYWNVDVSVPADAKWHYHTTTTTIPQATVASDRTGDVLKSVVGYAYSQVGVKLDTTSTFVVTLPKIEKGSIGTIWTPNSDESVASDYPSYIGTSDKDSDDYKDYRWQLYSDWVLTATNEVLSTKASQEDLDGVADIANDANVLAQNAVPQEVYTSWLEHDYQETIDSINQTSEENKKDIANVDARTTIVEGFYGDMKVKWNFIDEAFTFSEEGMFISNNNSQMAIQITSDKIVFWDNGNDVATITGEYLNIKKGIFLESAIIGNHQITKFSDSSPVTIIRYIGGL